MASQSSSVLAVGLSESNDGPMMPIHDFRCQSCNRVIEIRLGFDEVSMEKCCGVMMEKVITPIPAIFKGTGWGKDK
jgi:predicted nucleic acid-binding Zn ribbon protein